MKRRPIIISAFILILLILGAYSALLIAQENDEATSPVSEQLDENLETNSLGGVPPLYWDVRLRMNLGSLNHPKHVRLLFPRSEARQTILHKSITHGKMKYYEMSEDNNLVGYWQATEETTRQNTIINEFTVRVQGESLDHIYLNDEDKELLPSILKPSKLIDSGSSIVRKNTKQVVSPTQTTMEQVRSLFDFVSTAIVRDPSIKEQPASGVLSDRRGSGVSKVRLLVAMLRAQNIPARMVGGVVLKDLKRRKSYSYWAEAAVDGEWIEMDPNQGYFGRVPNRYLSLFRGDYPLMRYSAGMEFSYEFLVMQTTQQAATAIATPEATPEDENSPITKVSNEKTLTNPVAAIVWVVDRKLPRSLQEKITAQASSEQIKLSFLTTGYESRLFRGELLEDVIKSQDQLIREADVLILHTRDDAGIYALMSQGARKSVFHNKQIYISGNIYGSVSRFFGRALSKMLDPKGLYIFPVSHDVNDFWDVVFENFLNGVPIENVAQRWNMEMLAFPEAEVSHISWWRQFLLNTWVYAAESGVTPQNINMVLIMPIIALLIVLYRGVIGFETFGTFTPAIICVAFLRTGVFWGLFLFLVILVMGIALRTLLNRFHLFLVARMALLISLVSMVMLIAAIVGIWWGVGPLVNVSVFPMVIMAGMIENFTRASAESGWRSAVRISSSTLAICLVGYFVTEIFSLQSLVLVFPESLLLVMVMIITVGHWRGLRFTELWKYYRVGKPV